MLKTLDSKMRDRLLEDIGKKDQALAEALQSRLLNFEDLAHASPNEVRILLQTIEKEIWLLALRTASDAVKNTLFQQMSSRQKESWLEEINSGVPQKLSTIEKAQADVLKTVQKLSEEGLIALNKSKNEAWV